MSVVCCPIFTSSRPLLCSHLPHSSLFFLFHTVYELDRPSNTSTTKESQLSSIVVSESEAETALDDRGAEDGGYRNPMVDKLTPEDEYVEIIHNPHAGGKEPSQA